jgi:hypothetical protein
MNPHRFDALTRSLSQSLHRRRFLRRAGGTSLAALLMAGGRTSAAVAQDSGGQTVQIACEPCFCGASGCQCCIAGITGGGVVQTSDGDAQLVLFASRLQEGAPGAAGFVRWILPSAADKELALESVGPITYEEPPDKEQERLIRGTMQANGSGQYPFLLKLLDAGPAAIGKDTVALTVGDRVAEGDSTASAASDDFGYAAEGALVGGDLQLLGSVAPIPQG